MEIGLRTTVMTGFDEAIERTMTALQAEGFGVLTRIDMQSALKEKINVDFRKYVILGARNPPLAHRALFANPDAGLLLPCNVTVQEEDGESAVTAIDAVEMPGLLQGESAVSAVAAEVRGRLEKVISSLR